MELSEFVQHLEEVLSDTPDSSVAGDIEIDGKIVHVQLKYKNILNRIPAGGNPKRIREVIKNAGTKVEESSPDMY